MFNYAGTADLSNDTFKGNTAGGRGGGVENTGRSIYGPAPQGVMTVENSTFSNNSAADGGGIDNKRDSQLTITGSTISTNTASDSGGGVGNSDTEGFGPGTLTISTSIISGNTAANVGGGVLSDSGDTTLENGTVIKNNSAGEGGGISSIDGSNLIVDSTTFTGNSSTVNDGGGIDTEEGTLTLSNSTFTNNTSAEDGGAVFNYAGTADLSGSTFNKNTATGRGGAVENTGRSIFGPAPQGVMTIETSTFTNNTAADGGAIDNYRDSQLTITGSTINKNSASDSGGGVNDSEIGGFGPGLLTIIQTRPSPTTRPSMTAAAFTWWGSQLQVSASTFSGNQAAAGGGIANDNGAGDAPDKLDDRRTIRQPIKEAGWKASPVRVPP